MAVAEPVPLAPIVVTDPNCPCCGAAAGCCECCPGAKQQTEYRFTIAGVATGHYPTFFGATGGLFRFAQPAGFCGCMYQGYFTPSDGPSAGLEIGIGHPIQTLVCGELVGYPIYLWRFLEGNWPGTYYERAADVDGSDLFCRGIDTVFTRVGAGAPDWPATITLTATGKLIDCPDCGCVVYFPGLPDNITISIGAFVSSGGACTPVCAGQNVTVTRVNPTAFESAGPPACAEVGTTGGIRVECVGNSITVSTHGGGVQCEGLEETVFTIVSITPFQATGKIPACWFRNDCNAIDYYNATIHE